jgi:hypothetical protein
MTVTSRVHDYLLEKNTTSGGELMWVVREDDRVGPHDVETYSSGWTRRP